MTDPRDINDTTAASKDASPVVSVSDTTNAGRDPDKTAAPAPYEASEPLVIPAKGSGVAGDIMSDPDMRQAVEALTAISGNQPAAQSKKTGAKLEPGLKHSKNTTPPDPSTAAQAILAAIQENRDISSMVGIDDVIPDLMHKAPFAPSAGTSRPPEIPKSGEIDAAIDAFEETLHTRQAQALKFPTGGFPKREDDESGKKLSMVVTMPHAPSDMKQKSAADLKSHATVGEDVKVTETRTPPRDNTGGPSGPPDAQTDLDVMEATASKTGAPAGAINTKLETSREASFPHQPIARSIPEIHMPAGTMETPPKTPQNISDDIRAILKDVELPERRDIRGAADKPSAPKPEPPAAEQKKEKAIPSLSIGASPVVPLHTLKDDINDVIRVNKISLVKAAAMEQDRKGAQEALVTPKRRGSWGLVFGILFFVALGLLAIAGVAYVSLARNASVQIADEDSLVFAEQTAEINISNTEPLALKTQIAAVRNKQSLAVGSIMRIKPMVADPADSQQYRPATAAEFLKALGTHVPDDLIRALGDQFFFGYHTSDKNAPVFVFTVTSYDHAFPAMLEWEPGMNADLAPIFTAVTTMTTTGQTPVERTFKDEIMRNYDIRSLKDDTGNTILYYSFPNPHLLIVAESPYSFVELLSRLQAQREL